MKDVVLTMQFFKIEMLRNIALTNICFFGMKKMLTKKKNEILSQTIRRFTDEILTRGYSSE